MRFVRSLLTVYVLTSSIALAQFVPSGDHPICFFWQPPPTEWTSGDFDERFIPMVGVDVQARTGESAAIYIKESVDDLVAQFGNGTYIRAHVSILLQNFGKAGLTQLDLDAVEEPDPWPDDQHVTAVATHTPWLNTGAANAKVWMEEFIEELSTGANAVEPIRFHFDTELKLCSYEHENEVALAFNVFDADGVSNFDQWDDPDWKIPVGDPPGAKTLSDWWSDAMTAYSWPANPQTTLDLLEPPFWYASGGSKNNRAFFLWYQRIVDLAIDGAMKYAAYTPILTEWPSCEISDYAFTNIPKSLTEGTVGGVRVAVRFRHGGQHGSAA